MSPRISIVPRNEPIQSDAGASGDGGTISATGFKANYTVDKLALGQAPVAMEDPGPPSINTDSGYSRNNYSEAPMVAASANNPASGGAAEVMALNNRDYGDRLAGILDPFGNLWWIASPIVGA